MRSRSERDDGEAAGPGATGRDPGRSTLTARIQRRAREGHDAEGAAAVGALRGGGGDALPAGVRGSFEQTLGADLGAVRLHTGAASETAAEAAGARAFAMGNDIHFGRGQFQPDDPFGLHLLAHEVAHTQQPGGETRFKGDGEDSAKEELDADAQANAMVSATLPKPPEPPDTKEELPPLIDEETPAKKERKKAIKAAATAFLGTTGAGKALKSALGDELAGLAKSLPFLSGDIESLRFIGLEDFGLKLDVSGDPTLTLTWTPGGGKKKDKDDGGKALHAQTAALVRSLRAIGVDKDVDAELRAMLMRKILPEDDPLLPKAPPPRQDPLAVGSAIATTLTATPFTFGTVDGFAIGSAAVAAADAAALRTMAGEINQLADDEHTITIFVYGHAGEGEQAPLAGQRAAAVAKRLTATLDAKIVAVSNQTAGADGRKAEVVFMRQANARPVELALPTRRPVE